jgi:hypothetical protein
MTNEYMGLLYKKSPYLNLCMELNNVESLNPKSLYTRTKADYA